MSERRTLFINIFVLLLVQNGIMAVLASYLTPNWTAVMMIALAAGVIVVSMATAMMATRIASLHGRSRLSVTMPAANQGRQLDIRNIDLGDHLRPSPASVDEQSLPSAAAALKLERSGEENSQQRLRAAEDALKVLDAGLRRVAAGDLAARCEPQFPQEFEGLRCDFNRALDALDESISEITLSTSALHGECAEARLRLMQERSALAAELPQLSAAGNGLSDIADVLRRHEIALAEVAAMASAARQHHADQKAAATAAATAAADLATTGTAAGSAAAAMRDVAFRTNMLSVNISIAAANGEPTQDTLRSFAVDLRAIAEDGAEAARNMSMLERDIARSATEARSSSDGIAREEKHLDTGLLQIEAKLSDVGDATGSLSGLVARTGSIIGDTSRSVGRRKDFDHVLDTILARMAQELGGINRHCGRFIPVTLLRENAPPADSGPPRRRSHLRLIKT